MRKCKQIHKKIVLTDQFKKLINIFLAEAKTFSNMLLLNIYEVKTVIHFAINWTDL